MTVIMQDGTVEEYPDTFKITDGKNCVVCNSKFYHTNFDCESLRTEMLAGDQVKAMKRYDAEAQCFSLCFNCSILDNLEEY